MQYEFGVGCPGTFGETSTDAGKNIRGDLRACHARKGQRPPAGKKCPDVGYVLVSAVLASRISCYSFFANLRIHGIRV